MTTEAKNIYIYQNIKAMRLKKFIQGDRLYLVRKGEIVIYAEDDERKRINTDCEFVPENILSELSESFDITYKGINKHFIILELKLKH